MKRTLLVASVILSWSSGSWSVAGATGYYRYPALHGDVVVFTAEGDLWTVPAAGGVARRLTSHPGEESRAAIAPDGTEVAFSATYEGPTEVYVMPLEGGLPRRLTWEGEDALVVGWTPERRVLYATRHHSMLPDVQLVSVSPLGGSPRVIPLAQASDGVFDPDTGTLFFTRLPFQGSHTKRYRGGTAQQVWRLDRGAAEAVALTRDYPGTSKSPMLAQGRVIFVSDRDGTMNLWSMRPDGSDLRQLTHHAGWDMETPSLSAGRVAYKLGADLYLFDLASGRDARVDITLASDLDQSREKWVDKPADYLTASHLSATGDRVILTARGQVFVMPVKQGRQVEVTRAPGVRYRGARFLPGTPDVVALSDESGEVELWRLGANGLGAPSQITRNGTVLRLECVPSPNGAWIATTDKDFKLWVVRVADGSATLVATSPRWGFGGLAWSPDSAWLAWAAPAANTLSQIRLYRVADSTQVSVTSDRTSSGDPVFSPDGSWLYFLSDRHLVSAVPSPWGDFQPEPFFDRPTRVYAVALSRAARFPFAPATELMPAEDKPAKDKPGLSPATPVATVVDVEGLAQRLWQVPVEPGNYTSLAVTGSRVLFISRGVGQGRDGALVAIDVSREKAKPVTLLEGVQEFEVSADGAKVLARQGDALLVFDVGAKKVEASEAKVDLVGWKLNLQPREEWRQMFREAWRLERDYFYDRSMHKIDWSAVRAKYEPLVDRVTDRGELADLLGQMVSELSALHIFVYGGDSRAGKDEIVPASLGATLERDDKTGGVRVRTVSRGDPDYPEERSPLARPDVDVREGDVIELIDGVSTLSGAAPGELLRAKAGKQVLLRVRPAGSGPARDVIVEPILPARAAELRYAEWERTRRERVDALSGGAIGYVHLRAMNGSNYTEWARQFYPVFKRDGLIIDVRHNRGGNIDSWILEKLLRRAWFFWQPRVGDTYWNMQEAFRGHLVVLVDERTASDGEAFAEGFRRLGLGKVIGARTWGGEIWLSSSNFLVDKGIATAAETGVFGPEGQWLIEGWGVDPDVVVDNLPGETYRGRDAQLEAAVSHLQELIARQPVPKPSPPPYPDKSRP